MLSLLTPPALIFACRLTSTAHPTNFEVSTPPRSILLNPPTKTARKSSSTAADPTRALAWKSINTIRTLAMDAVEAAKSGHPGTPMALAPAAYVLWRDFLRHNPGNPDWANRDRFVLS